MKQKFKSICQDDLDMIDPNAESTKDLAKEYEEEKEYIDKRLVNLDIMYDSY